MRNSTNDHGGAIARAVAEFGGEKEGWLDLSTGINPCPYPFDMPERRLWQALPDHDCEQNLEQAARRFWNVPDDADVLAAPGASCLIASIPTLFETGKVSIPAPTYNEHKSAFAANGWQVGVGNTDVKVVVNPNNPDGRHWNPADVMETSACIIDESFCDVTPEKTLIDLADKPGRIILKSFGKFWGLGGLRLGFAIGDPDLIDQLRQSMGPWPVSGPALDIGTQALSNPQWAAATRAKLAQDADLLDALLSQHGFSLIGGTSLFRLYDCGDASETYASLARQQILTRVFPYSKSWVRFGLPGTPDDWQRLETALKAPS